MMPLATPKVDWMVRLKISGPSGATERPAAVLSAVTKNDLVTVTSVPVTYVIGKDGKVENILTPEVLPLTEVGLGDEVKALLDAKTETKSDPKPEAKPEPKVEVKPEEKS